MKKTKIVCTMGPNSDNPKIMRGLIQEGMDIARFNFSHGSYEEQKKRMDLLKRIRAEEGKPIAILLDTKGPEIRTGLLKDGKKVTLAEGSQFVLTTEEIYGDETRVSISYKGLLEDAVVGGKILIDDGLIELEVKDKTLTDIVCNVINGGELGERKGVNVPGTPVRLPALTEKDKEDILFGVEQDIDFIAASFVRNAECILEIRALLRSVNAPFIPIIAKIENEEGVRNIDEILRVADGIMVARGDLGVEIPAEQVPHIQKLLISKCNEVSKPVITATQMLDSMIRNPRPTRAEVTDVANAVYDGTDAVMLSGETAAGKHPVEALKMMVQICENTEQYLDYEENLKKQAGHRMKSTASALGYASVSTAHNLQARYIVVPTGSGATARVISNFHPKTEMIGLSPEERTLRRMQIYWGIRPYKSIEAQSMEEICDNALEVVRAKGGVESGDILVLTAGIPAAHAICRDQRYGASNMMRIVTVE